MKIKVALDQTQEIALSKASSKVRGPLMDTCSACGERYWPKDKQEHLATGCYPPEIHLGADNTPQRTGSSSGEKWRLMKRSSLTPAKRKTLGLLPRRNRHSRKKSK
jgi:hypothetical protein